MHKGKNFRIKDANILGCFFGGKGEKGMRVEGRRRAPPGREKGGRGFAAGSKFHFEYQKGLRGARIRPAASGREEGTKKEHLS